MSDDVFSAPKIMLMGLRRSGKTSIQRVVFDKTDPQATTFLPVSTRLEKHTVSSNAFVKFQVWDFPGQIDYLDSTQYNLAQILENCGVIVYVMDCMKDLEESQSRLIETIVAAHKVNPDLNVEVFIHKVDELSEDQQTEINRRVTRTVTEGVQHRLELKRGLSTVKFHLTSIYDHSVFEAFSRVVQKLMVQFAHVQQLMDMLNSNNAFDRSFLFDKTSKIFLANDSTPYSRPKYELCSDAIDVLQGMTAIYGVAGEDTSGASSVIHLSDGTVIYVKEISETLALVMMLNETALSNKALIDYNIGVFTKAVSEMFASNAQ